MNPGSEHHGNRERDLFLAALELPEGPARNRFLDASCPGEPELRRSLDSLLGHHRHDAFLEHNPHVETVAQTARSQTSAILPLPADLGPFRLLEHLGEGGCGTVYRAEQLRPVRRIVALKVIRPGMDTPGVIARFEGERQALARMEHPNIARVLEAGCTPHGRPYFVMELVEGVGLARHCRESRLPIRERIRLLVEVCDAIQHAHQKGIIHRDLKPSNILVPLQEGRSIPKVIDFGIAKAIDQPVSDRLHQTGFMAFVGTPAYTSPEQAGAGAAAVDTRSDIYSLGVILYELLTGETPFDAKRLAELPIDEVRRVLREEDPPRPSARRARRQPDAPDPAGLPRGESIEPDLDWIVLRCLEKDPTRRYSSARDLALDLERYLASEAVEACPPSPRYRLTKFVRRNRLLVGAGSAILLVLCLATAFSTWQAVRATRAEREESRLRATAEAAQKREAELLLAARRDERAALRQAYNSDMGLVGQALAVHNYGRATALLDRQRPQPDYDDLRNWEWRYYRGQTRSSAAATLLSHRTRISLVSISPDGRFALTADESGSLRLTDVPRGEDLGPLNASSRPQRPEAVAFSPDGTLIVTADRQGGSGRTLGLWSVGRRELIRELPVGHAGLPIEFAGNGRHISFPGPDPTTRHVWDVTTGRVEPPIGGPVASSRTEGPRREQFGSTIQSADGRVRVRISWEEAIIPAAVPATMERRIRPHDSGPVSWALSPDGSLLAAGPGFLVAQTGISLFDTRTGERVALLEGNTSWVPAVAFSPDGRQLASAGADQLVRIWETSTGALRTTLRGHRTEVNALAWLPDGSGLVSGAKDGSVCVWNLSLAQSAEGYTALPGRALRLTFLAPGEGLVTVGPDATARLWGANLEDRGRIAETDGPIESVQWIPGPRQLAIASRNGRVRILDWATRTMVTNFPSAPQGGRLAEFLARGDRLIAIHSSGILRTWSTNDWSLLGEWRVPESTASRAAVSSDGSRIALASAGRITVHELETGKVVSELGRSTSQFVQLVFGANNRILMEATVDGVLRAHDLQTGRLVDSVRGHLLAIHGIAASPDGERVATGSVGRESIKLWDVATRHEVATLAGSGGPFGEVTFSPDGTWLAAINSQGTVCLWKAPSLAEIDAYPDSGTAPRR